MQTLTPDRLKELLHYDPETGLFTRLMNAGKRGKIGNKTGHMDGGGYIRINVDGKQYSDHRLAFFYMENKWPKNMIDHIDGVKTNNKWKNLREATNSENQQNRKKINSNTGFLGVSLENGRYRASIRLENNHKHLGMFASAEEAYEVYLKAKRELHPFNTL